MKVRLAIDWYDGQENREEFKQLVVQSKLVLDQLRKICDNRIREYGKIRENKTDYADVAWPLVQADLNGYIRGIREMKMLLTLIDEDEGKV